MDLEFWRPFVGSLSLVCSLLQTLSSVYHDHSPLWEPPCLASYHFLQGYSANLPEHGSQTDPLVQEDRQSQLTLGPRWMPIMLRNEDRTQEDNFLYLQRVAILQNWQVLPDHDKRICTTMEHGWSSHLDTTKTYHWTNDLFTPFDTFCSPKPIPETAVDFIMNWAPNHMRYYWNVYTVCSNISSYGLMSFG